jgi:hypothetical protein
MNQRVFCAGLHACRACSAERDGFGGKRHRREKKAEAAGSSAGQHLRRAGSGTAVMRPLAVGGFMHLALLFLLVLGLGQIHQPLVQHLVDGSHAQIQGQLATLLPRLKILDRGIHCARKRRVLGTFGFAVEM